MAPRGHLRGHGDIQVPPHSSHPIAAGAHGDTQGTSYGTQGTPKSHPMAPRGHHGDPQGPPHGTQVAPYGVKGHQGDTP